MVIQCPKCHTYAPKELEYNYRKHRWMTAHVLLCKVVGRIGK